MLSRLLAIFLAAQAPGLPSQPGVPTIGSGWRVWIPYSAAKIGNVSPYASFEFAPASGQGITSPCACAAVTGADGQAVTDTRAESGYCTLTGLATTLLVPGSMVLCGPNIPRIETDAAGYIGALKEALSHNYLLRSEQFDDPAWTLQGVNATAPIVTANLALAPNNTLTADRIVFPPVVIAVQGVSQVWQDIAIVNGTTYTFTIYVQAVSGGLIQYLWIYDGASNVGLAACNFVASTITRCQTTFTSTQTGTGRFHFGNNRFGLSGSTDTVATTVYAWGTVAEDSSAPTSYMPTSGSAVQRSADVITGFLPTGIALGQGSFSAQVQAQTVVAHSGYLGLNNAAAGTADTFMHVDAGVDLYVANVSRTATVALPAALATFHVKASWGGATALTVNGNAIAGGAAAAGASLDRITIGSYIGSNSASGIYSRVCASTSSLVCQ